MSRFKRIGGRYGFHSGSGRVKNFEVDSNLFLQGSILGQECSGTIYYVDKNISSSGDGKSWDHAFKTVTLGIAALSNYDWLIIGPGNYDEAAKLSLNGLKGVKILGYGTGMQWGEGSTCIRNVTASTSDILDIINCQGIEIAGIGFIIVSAYDAINFKTTVSYSVHIHDCCFVGDCGGTKGLYGICDADGSTSPDLFVHDCKFFRWATAGIANLSQRAVISNNKFVVPNSGKGISEINPALGYVIISDNDFLGGGTSDFGIYSAAGTAGNFMISNNQFANFAANGDITITTNSDANCVLNHQDAAAGAETDVDPQQT